MIKQLTKLATHLDKKGLRREADFLDGVIRKIADDAGPDPDYPNPGTSDIPVTPEQPDLLTKEPTVYYKLTQGWREGSSENQGYIYIAFANQHYYYYDCPHLRLKCTGRDATI